MKELLSGMHDDELRSRACALREKYYGDKVFVRGLIEFTSYCRNNCFYCGLRRDNRSLPRYRLTKEKILTCCKIGYACGFRTFVLQGGEDLYFKDKDICEIVYDIKTAYPHCAVTLSIGEKSRESYKAYFDAGADRYLLRHETADSAHYSMLHPPELSLESRLRCLTWLKEIGYQTGCGFMVGSPYQTEENIISDLKLLRRIEPDMIGIGPFLPHKDTPFRDFPKGNLDLTLRLISILRIEHPKALIPSTTALATLHPEGRILGLMAGANVVMPNLSPANVREGYSLYDNKVSTGAESAEGIYELHRLVKKAGLRIVAEKGDRAGYTETGGINHVNNSCFRLTPQT